MTDLMPPRGRDQPESRRLLPGRKQREAGPDEETVRLERDLFERRRRGLRRPRRTRVLLAVGVVVVLAAATWAVGFSSLLAADRVEVSGTEQMEPIQVRAVAQVPLHRPLARIDLAPIRERVAAMPEVASVRVSRAWPHAVRLSITERTAVAVVPRGDTFRALAADGVLFRDYPTRPAGLPEVQDEQGARRGALREAASVVGSLPPGLLHRVDHVSVKSVDAIRLVLRSGRVVLWGNSSQSAQKADVLAALIGRDASRIDVSVPGRPTTRP